MGLRRPHGRASRYSSVLRPEVQPIDEQPPGLHVPPQDPAGNERDEHGRLQPGSRTVQSAGGRAKARKASLRRMVRESLGFGDLPDDHELRPHIDRAAAWLSRELGHLSEHVLGGEEPPPDVQSIVLGAAKTFAASEWLSDRGLRHADPDLVTKASRLSTEMRQAAIAARELAAKHAQARPAQARDLPPWLEAPSQKGGGG